MTSCNNFKETVLLVSAKNEKSTALVENEKLQKKQIYKRERQEEEVTGL